MFTQMQKLSAVDRLERYVYYLQIKDRLTSEEQESIEELFEDDG